MSTQIALRLSDEMVAELDAVITIPVSALGRTIGYLSEKQEAQLATAVMLAFDLDPPLQG